MMVADRPEGGLDLEGLLVSMLIVRVAALTRGTSAPRAKG
jgi:hypothetical protein